MQTLLLAARYGGERQLPGISLCGELSEEDSLEGYAPACQECSQASCVSGSTVVAAAAAEQGAGMPSPGVGSCAGAVAAAGLAMLPPELITKIIGEAAYPLSAWVRG